VKDISLLLSFLSVNLDILKKVERKLYSFLGFFKMIYSSDHVLVVELRTLPRKSESNKEEWLVKKKQENIVFDNFVCNYSDTNSVLYFILI
jgi:hypothetical protein